MSDLSHIDRRPTYDELATENETLKTEVSQLRRRISELEVVVEDLRRQVEELRRSSKRQAAPFSKGDPKENPKPPGRKPGHPPAHRMVPQQVDWVEDVLLPFEVCPECGGDIQEIEVVPQFQTDIPPIRPITTRFDIHVGRCQNCGRRVQGRHKDQTSDALGSASVQIGPNTLALSILHERIRSSSACWEKTSRGRWAVIASCRITRSLTPNRNAWPTSSAMPKISKRPNPGGQCASRVRSKGYFRRPSA